MYTDDESASQVPQPARVKWINRGVRLQQPTAFEPQTVRITPSLGVADQIDERDVGTLAAAGFKSIICNRPDSEGGTPSDLIRAEARAGC
jgi:hypothetical protein